MDKRAIDFILDEDWREPSTSLQASIISALRANLADDILQEKYDPGEIAKLYSIMRERPFSRTLKEMVKTMRGWLRNDQALPVIKNLQILISIFFSQEKTNKSKEVIRDYLEISLLLTEFQDYLTLYIIRSLYGKKLTELPKGQQEKIRELLHIHDSEKFYYLILPIVDGLLVRKNNS